MKNVKIDEFISHAEIYIKNAIVADEFVTVETSVGNAVVVSEAEWEIFKGFAEICLQNPDEALKIINKK